MGDSNIVARSEEKITGLLFNPSQVKYFYEFLDCSSLMELPIKGGTFTWSNQRSEGKIAVDWVSNPASYRGIFSSVINEIACMVGPGSIIFRHVPRLYNIAADCLAKRALVTSLFQVSKDG
ncbi:hypothetical protein V6N12_042369 [Hibiscus sabdariffa]|uniref:RNase H type-1 domain-containing protein n=1 Tax=Hibiscus sabdariffa TaxID=183260 RepID=A0ABR2EEK8_9ROSI